jgi:hypothetical protein
LCLESEVEGGLSVVELVFEEEVELETVVGGGQVEGGVM